MTRLRLLSYCGGKLSVVLSDKSNEYIFQNAVLKTFHRPNLPIKDLLNLADSAKNNPTVSVHYTKIVKRENDPRFKEPQQNKMQRYQN